MRYNIHIKFLFFFLIMVCVKPTLFSQMYVGNDTLYGNEWIDFSQNYYKIKVSENAMYRITGAFLSQNGININLIKGNNFQLFKNGKEVPLYVSSNQNSLSASDYIEFYGEKNGTEFDEFLYANPKKEMLNPKYSLFTDTTCYFLTWSNNLGKRYQPVVNNINNPPTKESYYFEYETQIFSNSHCKSH